MCYHHTVYTGIKFPHKRDKSSGCTKVGREKPMRNSAERTTGSVRKPGVGKVVFLRAEHSNSPLYQMDSPENIDESNSIWTQLVKLRNICAYRCKRAIANEQN